MLLMDKSLHHGGHHDNSLPKASLNIYICGWRLLPINICVIIHQQNGRNIHQQNGGGHDVTFTKGSFNVVDGYCARFVDVWLYIYRWSCPLWTWHLDPLRFVDGYFCWWIFLLMDIAPVLLMYDYTYEKRRGWRCHVHKGQLQRRKRGRKERRGGNIMRAKFRTQT